MKFLIVLAIIALVAPIYGQETEEKKLEKRGITHGLHSGGLGYGGGHGSSYSSYSVPVVRVSSGYGGHGLGGHGLGGHGLGGYGGLSGGHGIHGF